MASSSSSSSTSSSSSSMTFKCPHGMAVADISDSNNIFNKVISNNQLFFLYDSLADAAFPILTGDGVYYKQFNVSTEDWTPSGGIFWYEVAHYFDNKYPQIIAWKKGDHAEFKLKRIWYGSTRNAVVWSVSAIDCFIVVQADPCLLYTSPSPRD